MGGGRKRRRRSSGVGSMDSVVEVPLEAPRGDWRGGFRAVQRFTAECCVDVVVEVFLASASGAFAVLVYVETALALPGSGRDALWAGMASASLALLALFGIEQVVRVFAFGWAFLRAPANALELATTALALVLQGLLCDALFPGPAPQGLGALATVTSLSKLVLCLFRLRRFADTASGALRRGVLRKRMKENASAPERVVSLLRKIRHKYPLTVKEAQELHWAGFLIARRKLYSGALVAVPGAEAAFEGLDEETRKWLVSTYTRADEQSPRGSPSQPGSPVLAGSRAASHSQALPDMPYVDGVAGVDVIFAASGSDSALLAGRSRGAWGNELGLGNGSDDDDDDSDVGTNEDIGIRSYHSMDLEAKGSGAASRAGSVVSDAGSERSLQMQPLNLGPRMGREGAEPGLVRPRIRSLSPVMRSPRAARASRDGFEPLDDPEAPAAINTAAPAPAPAPPLSATSRASSIGSAPGAGGAPALPPVPSLATGTATDSAPAATRPGLTVASAAGASGETGNLMLGRQTSGNSLGIELADLVRMQSALLLEAKLPENRVEMLRERRRSSLVRRLAPHQTEPASAHVQDDSAAAAAAATAAALARDERPPIAEPKSPKTAQPARQDGDPDPDTDSDSRFGGLGDESDTDDFLYATKADMRDLGASPGGARARGKHTRTRTSLTRVGEGVEKIKVLGEHARLASIKWTQRDVERMNRTMDEWDFNVFEANELSAGRPLALVMTAACRKNRLFEQFRQLRVESLLAFVTAIENGYLVTNPYHNRIHAADVVQTTHYFLTHELLRNALAPMDAACALVAAAIHDFQHPGMNNSYLVATEDRLALRYNDRAVLEHMHVSAAFQLMRSKRCDVLKLLGDVEAYHEARETVIQMVLATDMSHHFEGLEAFKTDVIGYFDASRAENANAAAATGPDTPVDATSLEAGVSEAELKMAELPPLSVRRTLLKTTLHCADVSNPAKKPFLCQRWAMLVQEEFFRQGDKEREKGLKVSMFMDRNKPAFHKCQIGFITIIVKPLFVCYCDFLHTLRPQVDECLTANLTHWERKQAEEDAGAAHQAASAQASPPPPPLANVGRRTSFRFGNPFKTTLPRPGPLQRSQSVINQHLPPPSPTSASSGRKRRHSKQSQASMSMDVTKAMQRNKQRSQTEIPPAAVAAAAMAAAAQAKSIAHDADAPSSTPAEGSR